MLFTSLQLHLICGEGFVELAGFKASGWKRIRNPTVHYPTTRTLGNLEKTPLNELASFVPYKSSNILSVLAYLPWAMSRDFTSANAGNSHGVSAMFVTLIRSNSDGLQPNRNGLQPSNRFSSLFTSVVPFRLDATHKKQLSFHAAL